MDKNELKNELNDIKAKIKANSKDTHFADTLIAELLSIKGQLLHEPTLAHLPLKDIVKSFDDDTFNIYLMNTGEVVYRLKGGLTIIAATTLHSLNSALQDIVINQDEVEATLSNEDKEIYANDLLATTMILNLPVLAFSDLDFKYKIYGKIIDYMVELQEKLIDNASLQDETPIQNDLFKEATLAIDDLYNELES